MTWVGTRTYQFQGHVIDLWALDDDVHRAVSEDLDVHPNEAEDDNRGVPFEGNLPGGEQGRDVETVDHQGTKPRAWILDDIVIGLVCFCLHNVVGQMNSLEVSNVVFHVMMMVRKLIGHGITLRIIKSSTGRSSLVAEVARIEVLKGQMICQDVTSWKSA